MALYNVSQAVVDNRLHNGLSFTGKRMVPNIRDTTFPVFFQEKSGSQEMAFENADPYFLDNDYLLSFTFVIL